MKATYIKYARRGALIGLEIVAVVAGFLLLAALIFAWRISSGPMDVSFARDYIERALYDANTQTTVDLGSVVLEWPDWTSPLQLTLGDVTLWRQGSRLVAVRETRLDLSMPHLVIGRIAPVGITLERPVLRVVRQSDHRLSLAMPTEAAPSTSVADENPLMAVLERLSKPQADAERGAPLALLEQITITDASVIIEDHALALTWYVQDVDLAFGRDRRGLAMNVGLALPGGGEQAARIALNAVYVRRNGDVHFNVRLDHFDPRVIARKDPALAPLADHAVIVSGDLKGVLDSALSLKTASATLSSDNGTVALPGVYDTPFAYDRAALDLSYDAATDEIALRALSVQAHAVTVTAEANLRLGDGRIDGPVLIRVPELAQAQLAPLWPDMLRGEGVETWLLHNLSDGHVHNASAQFNLALIHGEDNFDVDIDALQADFEISGMTVNYRDPLFPVVNATGRGIYRDGDLDIAVSDGRLADMAVQDGRILLKDVADAAKGYAHIDVRLFGPLKTVFDYIAYEPIDIGGDRLGFDTESVRGQATLDVKVGFPLLADLPAEDVAVGVTGTLTNVRLPDVVQGMALSGGPMQLNIADGAARLQGRGQLAGRDVTFNWHQFIDSAGQPYSSRIEASLMADDALRADLGINIDDWITGPAATSIVYTEHSGGRSEIDVRADLRDSQLFVSAFDYRKPSGVPGDLRCTVNLRHGEIVDIQGLDITAPDLRVEGGRLVFGMLNGENDLRSGNLPRTTIGETRLAIEFERDAVNRIRLSANGESFDARPFLGGGNRDGGAYDGPAVIASINAAVMRTHDDLGVRNAKIYLDMDRTGAVNQFELDAAAGRGDLYVRLKPDATGRQTFRLEADDAGSVLRVFDVYPGVRGGRLVIVGEAPDPQNPRVIRGRLQLNDFRVVNAPVLARLLNAISLTGIQQLLASDGIDFARLESEFDWAMWPDGHIYAVRDGQTSGASIGLTFDGRIDRSENITDISGTIVPVSHVNRMIGNIPLVGDILAGGPGGAVFAATYTVRGPVDDPVVTVNPLAALAPGILRRLFFEE